MNRTNLTKQTKTIRLKPDASGYTVVAGTSNVNSDIVDTAGFNAVRFIVGFGTITSGAVTSIKVQQGAISTMSDAADLLGTGITVADTDDGHVAISDIIHPQKRYLRVSTLRATQNAVIDFALAELYRSRTEPVTQDATVISAETAAFIAEGTA